MLFTSFQYALFLPIIVLLFWVLPRPARLPMLLLASYLFYMTWMPIFILLIVGMTLGNWLLGKVLHNCPEHQRKLIFGIGIVGNLLTLGIFKYATLALDSTNGLVKLLTSHDPHWVVNIILPLGISFFTFEFIHYLFEIYRGQKPIDSFVLFALYAAFFPTQIAGPIKRYPDFVAQMQEFRPLRLSYFDEGLPLIIVGLGKKILLADTLAVFVQMGIAEPGSFGAIEWWLFAWAFAFQIYFDFSGYTDIARGSAVLFGYHIPLNFNTPYIAKNISEFWHRWHISLSTWLRDYLFIPLGGSRGGNWMTNRNLFLTMMLGGLWHGASWNFLIWGAFHGVLLIGHREFVALRKRVSWLNAFVTSVPGSLLSTILTFQCVCIGWIYFRVQDIGVATGIVKKMVLLYPLSTRVEASGLLVLKQNMPLCVPVAIIMVGGLLILTGVIGKLNEKGIIGKLPPVIKAAYCSVVVLLIVMFLPDNSQPFIYFQF
jgi:alginate O-acetyltransferase complex protein AlgI